MDAKNLHRKIAAIMAADMVGYSARMEVDEAGTLARHKRHCDEVINPQIDKFHGQIVKLMGDGILAEFASVVDAVNCGVSIQRMMADREIDQPGETAIQYRIGINLGDIVEEDGDLFGDGVNIAARLEHIAEPGGICISGTAFDHLKSNVDAAYESMGEVRVKNIRQPIRVYRVLLDAESTGRGLRFPGKSKAKRLRQTATAVFLIAAICAGVVFWWSLQPDFEPVDPSTMAFELPDKPSIAVLPFANLSNDKEQEYFADGLADDMITDLSKLPGLFVIARNSSFAYKGKPVDVREVARQLGVRYLLEGSVRRLGEKVRINAQLIDAVSGGHLWAERYEGANANLFEVQDKIRGNVIAALADELGYDQAPGKTDAKTRNDKAYDAYLNGSEHLRRFTPTSIAEAVPNLERALSLDPEYAQAKAALAHAYFSLWQNRWGDELGLSSIQLSRKAREYLAAALKQPTPLAHQVAANVAISRSQLDVAIAEAKEAIALDPNDPAGLIALAKANLYADRADAALPHMEKALRLDPQHGPENLVLLGEIQFNREDYEAATQAFSKALAGNPEYSKALLYLASSYGHLGDNENLEKVIERFDQLQVSNDKPIFHPDIIEEPRYINRADPRRLREGLTNAHPWRKLISGVPGDYQVKGAKRIDVPTAKTFFDRNVLFFDLQGGNPYSYQTIPGAIRGNVSKLTRRSLARIASKDQEIVFFERHYRYIGQAEAAAMAVYWGYKSIYHMHGGVWEWRDAGYPVESR